MTPKIFTATLVALAATLFAAWAVARRGDRPDRNEQHTRSGTPVVDEWGKESFPASDPPQSW